MGFVTSDYNVEDSQELYKSKLEWNDGKYLQIY